MALGGLPKIRRRLRHNKSVRDPGSQASDRCVESAGWFFLPGAVFLMLQWPLFVGCSFFWEEGKKGVSIGFFGVYQMVISLCRVDQNIELVYSLVSFPQTSVKGDIPFLKLVSQFLLRTCLLIF
jgi:hypothetical protein